MTDAEQRILEPKMENENFINHIDLNPYFNSTMRILMQESDRGAILLGVSQIDEVLRGLYERLTPSSISNSRKKELFNYSGPFGSISSKLDIALVLRILPKDLIEAIHKIRKIRNALAHKMESFELIEHYKELNEILALIGENADAGINKISTNIMMTLFVEKLCEAEYEDGSKMFDDENTAIQYISGNDEIKDALVKQQPKWTFAISVGIICAIIILHRDKIHAALGADSTLLSILLTKEESK